MRSERDRWARGLAALTAVAALLMVAGCDAGTPRASAAPSNSLGVGFTHTQFSAVDGSPAGHAARRRRPRGASRCRRRSTSWGSGAGNPEPSPGRYDFASLDRRMDFIRAHRRHAGDHPVLRAGLDEGRRRGQHRLEPARGGAPSPSTTRTSPTWPPRSPPLPRRPPLPGVERVQGLLERRTRTWDGEAYTELYNLVYDALKKVDPDIQVGGPYLEMTAPRPRVDDRAPPSSPAPGGSWTSGSSTPSTTGTSTRTAPTSSSSTGTATTEDDGRSPTTSRR